MAGGGGDVGRSGRVEVGGGLTGVQRVWAWADLCGRVIGVARLMAILHGTEGVSLTCSKC